MTQFAKPSLDATVDDGVILASRFNGAMNALYSGHSGAAAPPTPTEHMVWTDTSAITGAPPTIVYRLYSGGAWRPLGSLNLTTGVYTPTGSFTSAGGNVTGPINFPFGTALAPSVTFNGDNDTGLFRPAPDTIGFSTGGVQRYAISPTSMTLGVDLSIAKVSPVFTLNKTLPGQWAVVEGRVGGTLRWQILLGGDGAETGANLGSNFYIVPHNDAGISLDASIGIARDRSGIYFYDPFYPEKGVFNIGGALGFNLTAYGTNGRLLNFENDCFIQKEPDNPHLQIHNGNGLLNMTGVGGARVFGGSGNIQLYSTGDIDILAGGRGFDMIGTVYDAPNFTYYSALARMEPAYGPIDIGSRHIVGVEAAAVFVVGSAVFRMKNDGVGASSGGWVAESDQRLKSDVRPIDGALSKLQTITGCTYFRNDTAPLYTLEQIEKLTADLPGFSYAEQAPVRRAGFIANDVMQVLPEAVTRGPTPPASDPTGEGTLSLDTTAVLALAVQAIKELSAEVAALKLGKGKTP